MFGRLLFFIIVSMQLALSCASEEKRLALLIANEDYPASVGRLTNTHQDAVTIAGALEQTGFAVTLVFDANEDEMDSALSDFERKIDEEAEDGDEVIAFFYASMHGATAEVNGRMRNFLLPSKENIESPGDLIRTGIRMDEVLQGLALTDATAVFVISDACRNNLATSFTKSIANKGFVPEPTGPGMLIAYATSPGATTPDDGLFAKILSEEIVKPGRRATIAIVDAVDRISFHRDFDGQPYFNPGGLPEWFCFADCNKQEAEFTLEQVAREAYANGRAALKQRKFSTSSSWFTQACLGRIAAGCYELAIQYENGRGVGRDSGQAKSFFALACDRAHKEACFKEALYYSIGDDERISLLREACDGDVSDACESLGMQFEQGIGVKINELEAMNLYRRSCELGNAGGCSKLGQIVGVGNVQALELFIAGCEGGSVDGCAMLARVYSNGNGVERDLDKARLYYSEACYIRTSSDTLSRDREEINKRERLGPACAWLGEYYSAQEGDHQDYSLAHSYFLAGCKVDSPRSCSGLGFLWETGHRDLKKQANDPLQSDVRMAFKYYEQACDLGSEDSCEKVRSSCDEGNGVACTAMADRFLDGGGEALFSKAQLLESACDYGDGLGCARLGEMVEQGSGVRSDPIRALEIMQRGCNLGAPRACDLAKGREFSIKIHREDCSAGDRTACVWLHNSGYLNE